MFDLLSFIRQLLPPHRRQPLTIALARILFGPAQSVMTSLVQARDQLMDDTRTTGQVLVLEDLLSRTLGSITNTAVYITEGNSVNYDFTVVVPSDVPVGHYGDIGALLDRYKLAGKRYQISTGVYYDVIDNSDPLAWAQGYPYIVGSQLFLAINRVGTFYTLIRDGETTLVEDNIPYRHGSTFQLDIDPTKTYSVLVGTLTASVSLSVSNLSSQVGYMWDVANGRILFLGFNASEPPTVTITKPDGSTVTPPVAAFGVNFAGHDYAYRTYLGQLASGRYLIHATVPGANDYDGYITLTDANTGAGLLANGVPPANANVAPIINRQVAQQAAVVGTAFSQNIPADTFIDNDGTVASVAISGLPDGLTGTISGLVIALSGTPTTAGTSTVLVTATDNLGAATTLQYAIVVTTVIVLPPTPITGFGPSVVDAPANPSLCDYRLRWITVNGQPRGEIYSAASYMASGGNHVFVFINGEDTPTVDSYPTRNYPPGTWINIYVGVGPQKEIYHAGYNPKSTQQIWIGNPNT